jgi:hypothetical protein
LPPAPAAEASELQSWSAPARPPRSPPRPEPLLETKKLIAEELDIPLDELDDIMPLAQAASTAAVTAAADAVTMSEREGERCMAIPCGAGWGRARGATT